MWNREPIPLLPAGAVPWETVPDGEFGGGGEQRQFSRDPEDGSTSRLVRIRTPQRGRLAVDADIYIVQGSATWAGRPVGADHFVHVPAGSSIAVEPEPVGIVVFAGFNGPPRLEPEPTTVAAQAVDVTTLPWSTPEWSSRRAGADVFTKWLRRDDGTHVFLSAMLAGRHTDREEAHPVAEETLRLAGEVVQAGDGLSTPGSYCFRPAGFWHGPLGTRHGTLALVRSSGRITTEFRDPPPDWAWDTVARHLGDGEVPAAR